MTLLNLIDKLIHLQKPEDLSKEIQFAFRLDDQTNYTIITPEQINLYIAKKPNLVEIVVEQIKS